MRDCEPGANHRLSINRAPRCWNDDIDSGCEGQPSGRCAPNRLFVLHESDWKPSGIEVRMGSATLADAIVPQRDLKQRCFPLRRHSSPASPAFGVDSGRADIKRSVLPSGQVCASGRVAPFFVLFRPLFCKKILPETLHGDENGPPGRRYSVAFLVASTGSQSGPRTHSLLRVGHEKRNADECPPTGGKSNCHC